MDADVPFAAGAPVAKSPLTSIPLVLPFAFVVAAVAGFPSAVVTVTVVALVGACVVLPAPIILGYGLRAAEREDREAAARRAGGEPPAPQQ
jgi:hypothetical protein